VTQKWIALALALAVGLGVAPTAARADDAAVRSAIEHFKRGKRAYDLGHFLDAAAEYEKAYEAKESTALLYNLGQAYRGAGEHVKALNAYKAYLRNEPDASNCDEVSRFIEALKHTIETERATKEKPPVGTMPVPQPPLPVTNTPIPVVVIAPPPPPPPKREPDLQELALGRKLRIAGFATGGVAVASLVAGGVFAGLTANVNRQLNDPSGTSPTYSKSLESRGRTYQALETAGFVVGGAAAAAAVATLVVGHLKIKRNTFAVVPVVSPTRVAASLSVSF
jgi:tetratricopeptide (TPR) repeat protein